MLKSKSLLEFVPKYDYNNIVCVICGIRMQKSEYLKEVAFEYDYFGYWFALNVTHYRHKHIRYYDNSWRYSRYGNKNPEWVQLGYDQFKIKVNNRAKRQLIRAIRDHKKFSHKVKKELITAVFRLKDNEDFTINLAKKSLLTIKRSD